MSINEARSFEGSRSRGSLTKEQKAEAHAALFGIDLRTQSMNTKPLSNEEVEKMRALVAKHDGGRKQSREFDLNNPPKEPHVHRPYPTTVYKHETGKHKIVENEAELAAALDAGYQKKPASLPRDADSEETVLAVVPAEQRKAAKK